MLDGLTVVTGDLERLDHQLGLVVTDGPGGQLDAVADDVVLPGKDVQRVLRLQVLQAALRHGERVVREVDLAGLLVLLVHREVDDPAEPEDALLEVAGALGGLDPDGRHDLGDLVELAGAEEDGVARDERQALGEGLDVRLGEELGDRTGEGAVLADADPGEALGALLDGVLTEAVEELTGLARGVRHRKGADVLAA